MALRIEKAFGAKMDALVRIQSALLWDGRWKASRELSAQSLVFQ